MDPRDRLRPLPDGVACTVCGALVPAEAIRILAERDDLRFLEVACGACASTTLGLLQSAGDDLALVDPAPDAPGRQRPAASAAPISDADVRAMREFLSSWDGDVARLVRRSGAA